MSTTILSGNQASSNDLRVGTDATTGETAATTQETATQELARLKEANAWGATQLAEKQNELQQTLIGNAVRHSGESYGADDDESRAAAGAVKKGAKDAGVVVSDKDLGKMAAATAGDPQMRQFSSDIAAGKTPDMGAMYTAYQATPAAQFAVSADAQPATKATGGSVLATEAAGATQTTTTAAGAAAAATTGQAASGTGSAATTGTTATSAATSSDAAKPSTLATAIGTKGQLQGGSWMVYVTMAMFNAAKEQQNLKKDELKEIKKYNAVLDALNVYVSDTLMPAQQELQQKIKAKGKDGKTQDITVTLVNPMTSMPDYKYPMADPATGQVVLTPQPGAKEWPAMENVTQTQLSSKLEQVEQWRQSVQNEQQTHSSNFQSLDTQLTSWLNQLPTLIKSIFETAQMAGRNLA